MQNKKRHLSYEPLREIWNKYKLQDDTVVRHKFSLDKIIIDESTDNPTYDFKLSSHSVVDIPNINTDTNLTNPTSNEPIVIDKDKDLEKEMEFKIIVNKPQINEVEGNTWVFINEIMNKIWSTKKFDRENKPVYYLEVSATINIYKP